MNICVRFMQYCGRNLLPKFTIAAIFAPSLYSPSECRNDETNVVIGYNGSFFDALLIYKVVLRFILTQEPYTNHWA